MKINWRRWSEDEPDKDKEIMVMGFHNCNIHYAWCNYVSSWVVEDINTNEEVEIDYPHECEWCYADEVFGEEEQPKPSIIGLNIFSDIDTCDLGYRGIPRVDKDGFIVGIEDVGIEPASYENKWCSYEEDVIDHANNVLYKQVNYDGLFSVFKVFGEE